MMINHASSNHYSYSINLDSIWKRFAKVIFYYLNKKLSPKLKNTFRAYILINFFHF